MEFILSPASHRTPIGQRAWATQPGEPILVHEGAGIALRWRHTGLGADRGNERQGEKGGEEGFLQHGIVSPF